MVSVNETNREEFLRVTKSCDHNHPTVANKANEIIGNTEKIQQKALKIFYWVRDNIKFGISYTDVRASRTLKKRYGECGNKTTLHMALLRAVRIPARMHSVLCKREFLKGVIPNYVYNKIGPLASHFWVDCYLEGKWIACESIFDKPLYESLLSVGIITKDQIPTIDWDGQTDLIVSRYWVVKDRGFEDSYDAVYDYLISHQKEEGLPPKYIEKLFGWLIYYWMRRYTEKARIGQISIRK